MKFEEVIEEKGKRWSKPHVSSICMQYLTELHEIVGSNPCLLDLEATSMFDIVGKHQIMAIKNYRNVPGAVQPETIVSS